MYPHTVNNQNPNDQNLNYAEIKTFAGSDFKDDNYHLRTEQNRSDFGRFTKLDRLRYKKKLYKKQSSLVSQLDVRISDVV